MRIKAILISFGLVLISATAAAKPKPFTSTHKAINPYVAGFNTWSRMVEAMTPKPYIKAMRAWQGMVMGNHARMMTSFTRSHTRVMTDFARARTGRGEVATLRQPALNPATPTTPLSITASSMKAPTSSPSHSTRQICSKKCDRCWMLADVESTPYLTDSFRRTHV